MKILCVAIPKIVVKIPLQVYRELGRSTLYVQQHYKKYSKNGTCSQLPQHCKDCDCVCKPDLDKTKTIERSRDATARGFAEAFFIKRKGPMCVSVPSLSMIRKAHF